MKKENTIMKKYQYIQPKVEAMIVPADALMDPIAMPGSSEGPTVNVNGAPTRVAPPVPGAGLSNKRVL